MERKSLNNFIHTLFWVGLACLPIAGRAAGPSTATETRITPDAPSVNPGIRSYTVISGYQKGPNALEVLLPDDYTPSKKYPVVYLLPVNTGTSGQWGSGIVEARKANLQNAFGLIFVAPAYDTQPWFGDNPIRSDIRQNSYLLDVVLPFIDKEFSTVPGARGTHVGRLQQERPGRVAAIPDAPRPVRSGRHFRQLPGPAHSGAMEHLGFRGHLQHAGKLRCVRPTQTARPTEAGSSEESRRITLIGGGPGVRVGVDWYRTKLEDDKIPHVYMHGTYMQHNWYSGWLPLAVTSMVYPEAVAPSD